MKREALHTQSPSRRLDTHSPPFGINVEILCDRSTVVRHGVQRAAHIADEQAPRAWFINQEHHPCCLAVDLGEGRELDEADSQETIDGFDWRRERIGRRLGEHARCHQ